VWLYDDGVPRLRVALDVLEKEILLVLETLCFMLEDAEGVTVYETVRGAVSVGLAVRVPDTVRVPVGPVFVSLDSVLVTVAVMHDLVIVDGVKECVGLNERVNEMVAGEGVHEVDWERVEIECEAVAVEVELGLELPLSVTVHVDDGEGRVSESEGVQLNVLRLLLVVQLTVGDVPDNETLKVD